MENNSSLKFWKLLVIILAMLNIGMMFTIWYHPHRGHRQTPFDYMVKELNMSPQQVDAYRQMRDWHHDSVEVLRREGRMLRNNLFNHLKEGHADEKQVDSLVTLLGHNQELIEKVTYEHFKQVRQLCNDKQKPEFDKIINDVIKRMTQQGPPPPGREGEPPPPPDR